MQIENIIKSLRRMAVNTGTLNCLGCGFEHNCGIHGCRVLREAADKLDELQKEKEALVADLKKLEETGKMCILCSHCCAGGKPIYQQSDDYLEYCTSCDEGYSNFSWRGAPDERTDSGLLEE